MFRFSLAPPLKSGGLVLGRKGKHWFSPLYVLPEGSAATANHVWVCGVSGSGKSKALEHILYQLTTNGRGYGLIDPHSLLADDLLRNLISAGALEDPEIRERVVYVDPSRSDFVIPFNPLSSAKDSYEVAAGVLEAFRRTWPESLREAPHFSNVATAALIVLVENNLSLMEMHRLLTNKDFREMCLEKVREREVVEYFHDRYDRWEREAPAMKESTLNKVGAFSLNPKLKVMLGQGVNHLNFAKLIDENHILILDLGRSDGETNRLIGNLVTTGIERAMRRRTTAHVWYLVIDEFAGFVANEGSVETLAHVLSEARKYGLAFWCSHQSLSQLTPRMLGALSNVQTKIVFGAGRADSEYFAKMIGRVDSEAVKRDAKTETQHELFEPIANQWEQWIDHIRFQKPRHAVVARQDGSVANITTTTIPAYSATDEQVEDFKAESLGRYGIPYAQALRNLERSSYEGPLPVSGPPGPANYGW